ncbi:prephenate dehydrogenase [Niabella drilacis]|uniref:Prephenate dehydrogenase n=1 Tax=Niabella drilacis (strain DSM 25811 / CCM 8410 / CCUG 62505 / LMG 26954 / E90) TaxID=1285928 RepID=A0A1G6M309_NIADE|nr:prephenate dehydrogenase [Niabella drilacis]SDC49346.1 prephenate dehydrogenase [Niabella drilacis]
MVNRKKIAIIGVGLIGGSMALQLHEKKLSSLLIGVEASKEHASQALEYELVDEFLPLNEAIAAAEVIVLAIPVNKMVHLLPRIMDQVTDQIVMDMGSTKASVIEVLKQHPRRGRFVATHPMWGTEYSGPKSAVRGAFEGKAVIICNPNESDADALEWVKKMYGKIGMRVVEMEAKAHDLHVAYVSHISHITSFALANTVLEKEKVESAIFEIASAGFESTVRLAKSNPDMWVPIFLQNKDNIIDVLTEHIDQLTKFKESIQTDDSGRLQALIADANKIRRIIR